MQIIDREELLRVVGGAPSPNMQVGPGGSTSMGGGGGGGGGGGNPYALGGQVPSPGAFSAHYPGGGGNGRP